MNVAELMLEFSLRGREVDINKIFELSNLEIEREVLIAFLDSGGATIDEIIDYFKPDLL